MCDQSSKFGSLARFVMPIIQGAAAGAQSVPGPRVGGGVGFGGGFFQGMGAGFQAQQQKKDLEMQRQQMRQEMLMKQQAEDRAQKTFEIQQENAQKQKDFFKSLSQTPTAPVPAAPPLLGVPAPEAKPAASGGLIGDIQQVMQDPNEAPGMRAALTDAQLTNNPKPLLDQLNKVRSTQNQPMHWGNAIPVDQATKAYPNIAIPAGSTHVQIGFNRKNEPVSAIPAAVKSGEEPLGADTVANLNQALSDRFNVLNPKQLLPKQYTLPTNATQKDFDRVDKMLQQVESAKGTKAQQDTANAIRQQTLELAKNKVDATQSAIDRVAVGLANGDLTRIKDIASLRSDQRLLLYDKVKQLNPSFNTAQIDRQIKMYDSYTNGQQGNQLQSFGTFMEHAGALKDTVAALQNTTDARILNRPINWLRQNVTGNEQYQKVLAALDPVQKEFESYLLNNRALYVEDRKTVDQIINGDLSPNQINAALNQMGHTVQARYNNADKRFKSTMNGKSIEDVIDPFTPEAKDAAKKIGIKLGSEGEATSAPKGATQKVLSPDGKTVIGHVVNGEYVPLVKK